MNIDDAKMPQILNTPTANNIKRETQKEYEYHGEIDPHSGALILSSNRIGWFDAQKTYYINKDGSGRMLTAWGSRNYPKNTFDEVIKRAQDTIKNADSKLFSDSDVEELIKQIETCIYKNN